MQRYLSNKAALFLAPFSAGLLLVAPLNQAQAQPNGGVVVPTEVHRVVIDGNSANDIEKLINALSMPNPTTVLGQLMPIVIELSCGLQFPLTGRHSIAVNSFRSVVAPLACARGPRIPVERVPRIFVTDHRAGQPLFVIGGDHVVFSGFRLEGPIQGKDIPGQTSRLEQAIRIHPQESGESAPTLGAIRSIEISNMEIFHWSGAGIDVLDNNSKAARGRLFNTNEGALRITNNFIHDNRHDTGFGYGVVVGKGAYALIAQNVFDENRHAIAGDSLSDDRKDASGYTVRENLILPGGGLHCASFGFLNCWLTHQIDMHGSDSTSLFGITTSQWCCGTAGETMLIERNTVLYIGKGSDYGLGPQSFVPEWTYTRGLAIKIRGNPVDKAVVDGNVFRHPNRGAAIAQNGGVYKRCSIFGWPCYGTGEGPITNPIKVLPNNVFDVNPLSALHPESDSCDFGGSRDGKKDLFMATGVTWWARSPVDSQWRYLNTMPEGRQQLELGDFDSDGICDIGERPPTPGMLPRRYSKSGTGPWVPLIGGVGHRTDQPRQ